MTKERIPSRSKIFKSYINMKNKKNKTAKGDGGNEKIIEKSKK